MTYMSPNGANTLEAKGLDVAMFRWSASSVNTTATLTSDGSTWATAPSVSGGVITLPAGHYYALGTCGITRAATSQNVQFGFFVDGVLAGKTGQTDLYGGDASTNANSDLAEAVITVNAGQTKTLQMRVTASQGTFPTITTDSAFVLMRSAP